MDSTSFGHGEREIFDRGPWEEANAGMDRLLGLTDGDFLCVLRKMYHTFMFDIREFAVEYSGASDEKYLSALPWLTYFQTIIYELDLLAEQALAAGREIPVERITAVGGELRHFLRSNRLSDEHIETALDAVVHYLCHEGDYCSPGSGEDVSGIFHLLDCKTADLDILLRLAARLCEIEPSTGEMAIFRALERVREIFDDVRDYREDAAARSFNTVSCVEMIRGRDAALVLIRDYIEKEYAQIRILIEQETPARQERFALFEERWLREREHYEKELGNLFRQ